MKRKKIIIKDREYREEVIKRMKALIGIEKDVQLYEDLAIVLKLKKDKIKQWVNSYKRYGVGTFYEVVIEFAKKHNKSLDDIFREKPFEKTEQSGIRQEISGIAETQGEYLARDKGELHFLRVYRNLTDTQKEQAIGMIKILKIDKGGEAALKKTHDNG